VSNSCRVRMRKTCFEGWLGQVRLGSTSCDSFDELRFGDLG